MSKPKAYVFCEESQKIAIRLDAMGIDAKSVDLQDCSGGRPDIHIKADVREFVGEYADLIIFHPTCRFIANSGVHHLQTEKGRIEKMKQGCEFFNLRHQFNSSKVLTENPIPHGYAVKGFVNKRRGKILVPYFIEHDHYIGMYDQLIQPWHFGDKKMKATCLWLKGLPKLKKTNVVGPPPKDVKERMKWQECWTASPGPDREKIRSVTYDGIADAIAGQYGSLILKSAISYPDNQLKPVFADTKQHIL